MKTQRLDNIEKYILKCNICTIEDLCNEFNVSLSTIRRDIDTLADQGKIEKVHGGVKVPNTMSINTTDMEITNLLNITGSIPFNSVLDGIAKKASTLVNDNDIIILGSGYTTYHMVRHLVDKQHLTIITNNLLIVYEALRYNFDVMMMGGNLNKNTLSTVGIQPGKYLETLNANKAFIGCNGITINNGFSNASDLECQIKKTMIKISTEVIILADSSKFNKLSLYNFANFEDINAVITDISPSSNFMEAFSSSSTHLFVAE